MEVQGGVNNNQTSAGPCCKLCGYQNNNTDQKNPSSFHLLEVIDNPECLVITYQCPSCSLRVVEAFQGNVERIKVTLEGLMKDLIRRIGELKKGSVSVNNGDPPVKPAAGSSQNEGCSESPLEQRSSITSSEDEGSTEGNDNDDKESEPSTPMDHNNYDNDEEEEEDYMIKDEEDDDWVDREDDADLSATEESEEEDDDSYMRDEIEVEVEVNEEEDNDEFMDIEDGKDDSEELEENDDDYLINEGLLIKSEEASAIETKPVENNKVRLLRSSPGRRCHQCPMIFQTSARLQDHIGRMHGENREPENPSQAVSPKCKGRKERASSGEKKWSCDHCEKTFHTKSQRRSHIGLLHTTESHDCPDCPGVSFGNKNSLHRHRISVHQEGEWSFVCPHSACGKGFISITELRTHQDNNHKEGKLVCPKKGCGKEFGTRQYLNSHLQLHKKGIELLKCSKCPKEFDNFLSFQSHERRHRLGETKKYPCPYPGCGKKFPDAYGLNVHSETHSEERKYKCEKCGKTFKTHSSKKIHIRLVHREQPFKCPQCPMTFKSKDALSRHLCSNHEQEWPFLCPIPGCGKGFIIQALLKEHIDTNHSDGKNICQFEGCGKEFANRRLLKAHEKLHANGIGSLKCEKCGKDFYNSRSLKQHVHNHERSENKNLPCPYCSTMFASQRSLQDHINRHEGVKKYQCESCGRSFSSAGNLQSHQQLVHEKGGKPRPSRMGDLERSRIVS